MELNSKKLENTSRIIYYSISIILCFFLTLLADIIIDDLEMATQRPSIENFENKAELASLRKKETILNLEAENLQAKKRIIEKTIARAKLNYNNQKQSFDTWAKTRVTIGPPLKDQEIISRAIKLDEFYAIEKEWRAQLYTQELAIDNLAKKQQQNEDLINRQVAKAEAKFESAYERYELKVFLFRLLFVGPILALGIFFFVRYRRHKFWPLFFGFTLFSVYAFFFGLVPYLPSYGGYVHYTVGILLSAGLGFYAIKTIRQFIETKQAELKISTTERAKNVQTAVAIKALENHFCPSCGKDFILKKWELASKLNEGDTYKLITDFCRHCGLVLFKNCAQCGHKNFAHLPFCASCGTKQAAEK